MKRQINDTGITAIEILKNHLSKYRESIVRLYLLHNHINKFICSLNICKEILDGIRIYFDFKLNDILLYKGERGQTITEQAKSLPLNVEIKTENK